MVRFFMIFWDKDKALSKTMKVKMLAITESNYYRIAKRVTALPKALSTKGKEIIKVLEELHHKYPSVGYRKCKVFLQRENLVVNGKKIRKLKNEKGLKTIYPKKRTTISNPKDKKEKYLLKGLKIEKNDHVWGTDITYIRTTKGYMYLIGIIDLYSRYFVDYRLTNTMNAEEVLILIKRALKSKKPVILNTDQGSQFTSLDFKGILKENGVKHSMTGQGRCKDNIHIERFWNSYKREELNVRKVNDPEEILKYLDKYVKYYNEERPHQSLGYKTPSEVYRGEM